VKIQTITDDIAEASGVKENSGALVASVTPGSPAAKAGIQDGDVILKFDGKDVTSMRGLPRLVAQTPIGKDVDVELLRKGQRLNLKVAVGRLAEESEPAKAAAKEAPKGKGGKGKDSGKSAPPSGRSSLIGLVLAPLNEELREKHGIGKDVKGVIVLEVDPASPMAEKGVKVGDVIVEVAYEAVSSLDDIAKSVDKVKKAGRKNVLLRLEDGKGDMRLVAVPVQ
jgi:serine protease Do